MYVVFDLENHSVHPTRNDIQLSKNRSKCKEIKRASGRIVKKTHCESYFLNHLLFWIRHAGRSSRVFEAYV